MLKIIARNSTQGFQLRPASNYPEENAENSELLYAMLWIKRKSTDLVAFYIRNEVQLK